MLFKVIFILKYIKIIYFYFLKIIFNISILKWYENIKNMLIFFLKFKIFLKTISKYNAKHWAGTRNQDM